MPTYLITGGAGFIGSNLVHELVNRGETVRVVDDFSTGRAENLAAVKDKIDLIEGDIDDLEICRRAVAGIDYILHHAAIPSVQRSVEDPLTSNRANADGTLKLLVAARDAGARRLVYASSSSLYGDSPTLPKQERMAPSPKSPYAVAKLSGEYYCQVFSEVYGLETVCLRYFNVFGPRQDPTSPYSAVIPLFIKAMLLDQSPIIFGDGRQTRDFTYVQNNIEANLLALTTPNIGGEVFNIACGYEYSLLDLIEALNDILGKRIEPTFAPPRAGEVLRSVADIGLARQRLGYDPAVDFREGLRRTVEWYRKEAAQ